MAQREGPDGLALIEESVAFWWGLPPPHATALSFARDVEAIPQAFSQLAPCDFDAEPADYLATLERFADPLDLP